MTEYDSATISKQSEIFELPFIHFPEFLHILIKKKNSKCQTISCFKRKLL